MGNLINWPPTWSTLLLLPALFVAFTVHELAHALVAFILGDTSQVERKRLSFNPLRHVSWLGMAAFMLIGLGWAKPVWVDRTRLRIKNPDAGMFLVSIAGSAANLLTAILVLVAMSVTVTLVWGLTGVSPVEILEFFMVEEAGLNAQGMVVAFTYHMMMVNLLLALFNMLPLPPLDGFQALLSLYNLFRTGFKSQPRPDDALPTVTATLAPEETEKTPARIHFDIGLEYHQEGQLDEALARYRQAIAHDENYALAYYNQGLAYWAKGRRPLATGSFKAAMRSASDPMVQVQASLRLRELAQAEEGVEWEARSAPPPLGSDTVIQTSEASLPPLDPGVARRVWLNLGIGGALLLIAALAMWVFVTAITLASVGQV
jgi:Zn-dependent protease